VESGDTIVFLYSLLLSVLRGLKFDTPQRRNTYPLSRKPLLPHRPRRTLQGNSLSQMCHVFVLTYMCTCVRVEKL